jgi:hypothetical protein
MVASSEAKRVTALQNLGGMRRAWSVVASGGGGGDGLPSMASTSLLDWGGSVVLFLFMVWGLLTPRGSGNTQFGKTPIKRWLIQ